MFDKALRIGTRDSQLALLQAHKVVDLMEKQQDANIKLTV
jgi:porphobilinogen deaminase